MKYVDEFRDGALARNLARSLQAAKAKGYPGEAVHRILREPTNAQ